MAKAQHEFKSVDIGVKLPDDPPSDSLFDEAPPPPPPEYLMFPVPPVPGKYGEFPYNHAPLVILKTPEEGVIAQWQTSRRWNRRWEQYGFWAVRNTGGKPVDFEPIGYRELQE